ncbi:hypothetical protein Rsub_12698 [Raphidocelis subcapitata]|uniref:Rab5-interacting n=1 Tax=Raphidocelis subcapitata TaxID=307507 RepID=A0A2V0PLH6_9CHLO|nr:hypothetical protein Rsub_12698 [Raphidocelis subcapitata]|eukprot:GBF99902.1 hypothetical protein Rsub_12698 [Raphidocelis subcapitata]
MPPRPAAAAASASPAAAAPAQRRRGAVATLARAVSKLAEGSSADWDQEEALDLIYWWRQALGLLAGALWGYLALPGLYGFIGFLAINIAATMFLVKGVMGVEDDEWENAGTELMQEGMPYSMSAFMVMWVLSHTMLNT